MYEYFANDKYNVSYSYNEVYYESKELDKIYSNEKLYPEINYNIDLGYFGQQEEKIKDLIVLDSNGNEISFGENRKTKVSELSFAVFFKCKNETYCDSEDGNDNLNLYLLILEYYGYFCDHQNPESPIKRDTTYKVFPFTIEDRIDYYLFDWKIIKYEE